MSIAKLDTDRRLTLEHPETMLEIQRQDGQVLGIYLPEADYRKMLYELAEARCPVTPEERERRRQEKGGSSLAEFWNKLGVTV